MNLAKEGLAAGMDTEAEGVLAEGPGAEGPGAEGPVVEDPGAVLAEDPVAAGPAVEGPQASPTAENPRVISDMAKARVVISPGPTGRVDRIPEGRFLKAYPARIRFRVRA